MSDDEIISATGIDIYICDEDHVHLDLLDEDELEIAGAAMTPDVALALFEKAAADIRQFMAQQVDTIGPTMGNA